jgi:hypothetical protein
MTIPEFNTKKELFQWLYKNKHLLITEMKSTIKTKDCSIGHASPGKILKQNEGQNPDSDELKVQAVINTTNIFDSHKDVHFPGVWSKTLNENKNILFLQEHRMRFETVIASDNDLSAFTKNMSMLDLGSDLIGTTEALIFDALIRKDRNEFMHKQYKEGFVKNHSVGMIYVKLDLAINDDDFKQEFALWNSRIDEIINKKDAVKSGFFWAVFEAKLIEGSAVLRGSNPITPVLESSKSFEARIKELEQQYKSLSTVGQPRKNDTYENLLNIIKTL